MRLGAPIRHPLPPALGEGATDDGLRSSWKGGGVDCWSRLPLNETAGGSGFWILEQQGTGLRPAEN